MKLPRQRQSGPNESAERAKEGRLVDAEKRANVLFEKAEWLHAVVTRRDQQNHWQDSVNRLFLGGKS